MAVYSRQFNAHVWDYYALPSTPLAKVCGKCGERYPVTRKDNYFCEACVMTYSKAKLIIWNPNAYSKAEVKDAIVYILGTLGARGEDLDRAMGLL